MRITKSIRRNFFVIVMIVICPLLISCGLSEHFHDFKDEIFTITFHPNGGEGGPDFVIATYRKIMPNISTQDPPEREGHNFAGYSDLPEGGTEYYFYDMTSNKIWDKFRDDTLYAQWIGINQRVVAFNDNGGDTYADPTSRIVDVGQTVAPPETNPTRIGYNFDGWYREETGITAWNFSSDVVTENITLFARWNAIAYTIEYIGNHANVTGDTPFTTHIYDEEKNLSANGFEVAGYTFIEWNTASDGSGISYANNEIVLNLRDTVGVIRLYAQWSSLPSIVYEDETLPNGTVGVLYEESVSTVLDVVGVTYASTDAPDWLTVAPDGNITGTPTEAGTYDFTVIASADGYISAEATFTITILPQSTIIPDISWYDDNDTITIFDLNTAEQLAGLAHLVNGENSFRNKTINLDSNIDLAGYDNWTPIGLIDALAFNGTFDGKGHIITGLTISGTSTTNQGMFGSIGYEGVVRNLGIVDVKINVSNSSLSTGGIAGANLGIIENCFVTGSISGLDNVGGIAGWLHETVRNSYAAVDVSGNRNVGGIVGTNQINSSAATVENCYAVGTVKGNDNVGGIAGGSDYTNQDGRVRNSVALNLSIERTGIGNNTTFGRVRGFTSTSGRLTNNYGRDGMTLPSGITASSSLTGIHGEDVIESGEYNSVTWWDYGRWSLSDGATAWNFTNVWEWNSITRLPILRGFADGTQNHTVLPTSLTDQLESLIGLAGGPHTVTVSGNQPLGPQIFQQGTDIILKADSPATIELSDTGRLFTINNSASLRLEGPITIKGIVNNADPLMQAESGGTLFIGEGVVVTGNYSSTNGGGVYVNGGAVILQGGTISGNAGSDGGGVFVNYGKFTMSAGTIFDNTSDNGGGVFVNGGEFIMQGGTIRGNTARTSGGGVSVMTAGNFIKQYDSNITGYNNDAIDGNVVKNASDTVVNNMGHAVWVNTDPPRRRENTAGAGVDLYSSQAGAPGGWE